MRVFLVILSTAFPWRSLRIPWSWAAGMPWMSTRESRAYSFAHVLIFSTSSRFHWGRWCVYRAISHHPHGGAHGGLHVDRPDVQGSLLEHGLDPLHDHIDVLGDQVRVHLGGADPGVEGGPVLGPDLHRRTEPVHHRPDIGSGRDGGGHPPPGP